MEQDIAYLDNVMMRVIVPAYQTGIDGKRAYGNFWILPLQILVLAAPEYKLYEQIEKTMQEGNVVRQRETSVSIYPAEWQRAPELRKVVTVLGGITLDYYSLEPLNEKAKIIESLDKPYDAHTEKNRPRINMMYFPATPLDAKERELAGFVLTYELPISRRKATLPQHQKLFQEADKEDLYDNYRYIERDVLFELFKFANYCDYPQDKFLAELTSFLEYDIDFLEADGRRVEWWDTILRNLTNRKFVSVHRFKTMEVRKLRPGDALKILDLEDFNERKKSR